MVAAKSPFIFTSDLFCMAVLKASDIFWRLTSEVFQTYLGTLSIVLCPVTVDMSEWENPFESSTCTVTVPTRTE